MKFRWSLYLALLAMVGLGSCGEEQNTSLENAIWTAQMALEDGDCQGAFDALEVADEAPTDAVWLQTKAAAYACLAGFNLTNFFKDDVPKLSQVAGIGGATLFSTSHMSGPMDADFTNMQKAIDTLLYPGNLSQNEDPTVAKRKAMFSDIQGGDLHGMLMYLLLANLGKYLAYYGNTSAAGAKGGGPYGNTCFITYNPNQVIEGDFSIFGEGIPSEITLGVFFAGGVTGACDGSNGGDLTVRQMCQGVVLFNNFLEVFGEVATKITTSDWSKIVAVRDIILQLRGIITNPDMTVAESVLSQQKCETVFAADNTPLKIFFAIYLETLLR